MNSPVEVIKNEKEILLRNHLDKANKKKWRFFTQNQDAICVLTLDGQFVLVNSLFENMTEYSVDELIKKKFQSLSHIESLDKVFNYFHRSVLGQVQNFDCKMINKSGKVIDLNLSIIPIIEDDEIIGVYIAAKDITEFKKKKIEIRKLEELHRVLTENVLDIILSTNLLGKVIYVSPSCKHLLGYNSDELIGKHFSNFIHKDDLERAISDREMLMAKFEHIRGSYRFQKKDGTFIWMESICHPLIDPDTQNSLEVISVIRDITERKKTQGFLLNSEKLNIAGQLAAGICHEVRNPLTAIKGFIQLIEARTDNKQFFDIINSEMNRIELILNELLILAKPNEIKFVIANIKTLIEESKTLIDTLAIMNNIQIEIINEIGDLNVNCDKDQIKQVFINFLKNAVEAMPEGGKITIELLKLNEEKLKILIKDTGTGIPQQILNRLGQPFFTTKESGTGLGIMISKQIIENHYGTLQFWSDKNGTVFEVILPL